MNFGNITDEILHFARLFSCENARFAFQNFLTILANHFNILILKLIFLLAPNLLNPVIEGNIVVFGFFAALAIVGIAESAVVALTIFLFHRITLTLGHHRLLLIKI
jgi:hypothetical protein